MTTGLNALRNAFDRTAQGDGRAFLAMLADEVEWSIIGTTDWSRTYSGKESVVRDLLIPLSEQFEGRNLVEAKRFIATGDTVVVEGLNHSTTIRREPYPNRYCWIFEMRGDQVVRVTEYCDTALVERVLDR